jgi:hypothetical protein
MKVLLIACLVLLVGCSAVTNYRKYELWMTN